MEKYNFVGKNLTEEKIITATKKLETEKKESNRFLMPDIERQKNRDDLERIEKIQEMIRDKLKKLGLSNQIKFDANQIHFWNIGAGGTYKQWNQKITINERMTKYQNLFSQILNDILNKSASIFDKKIFRALIHESTHAQSINKYKIEDNGEVDYYRVGYHVFNKKTNSSYFLGFNEAVVEKTVEDILLQGLDMKKKPFHAVSVRENNYKYHLMIVDNIADKIARTNSESKRNVWDRFEKGQFTGEMMHLRDVEKAFGPGSLRILASMGAKINLAKKILYYTYFSTDNKLIKDSIARIVLAKDNVPTASAYGKV